MKYITLIVSLSIILSCSRSVPSYKDAIKNCEANKETVQMIGFDNDTTEIKMMSESCIEGYLLPEFNIESINGEIISSESLKGKLTIINFWFEACPPCIAEIPGLNLIKEKFGTNSINYLAISMDSKNDVVTFLENKDYNFTQIANGKSIYRDIFKAKWGFPFTIITNRQNIILKSFGSGSSDSTAIEQIINKIEPILIKEKAYK